MKDFQFKKIDLTGVDSKEERYFEWWLNELIEAGYIKKYVRSESYILVPKSTVPVLKEKPTKKEPDRLVLESEHLLANLSYTPDYDIYWEEKALDFLVANIDELNISKKEKPLFYCHNTELGLYSCSDVKPNFFRAVNSSSVTFPLKKKMMWEKFNIYVNKVVPIGKEELFAKTFTPLRYFYQDQYPNRKRTISQWRARTIKQFLQR